MRLQGSENQGGRCEPFPSRTVSGERADGDAGGGVGNGHGRAWPGAEAGKRGTGSQGRLCDLWPQFGGLRYGRRC